ncbi:MAG: hypothetical protein IT349_21225 [Candidatus Eisenbacteria bacterium]|nr:hypothetical protein [Candidatus Eisenbacteria bacterium]
MFDHEHEMTNTAVRWLGREGFAVKHEFSTPWGVCDLVGVIYDEERVAQRLAYGQKRPISSIARAAALLKIPDVESGDALNLAQLRSRLPGFSPTLIRSEVDRLIVDGFVHRQPCGSLQKRNGWAPLHTRLVAVELKLRRIEEAMRQALRHLGFASESYVALPAQAADRVLARPERWARYLEAGVGVLRLTPQTCRVSIRSTESCELVDPAIQLLCADRFWTPHLQAVQHQGLSD